MATGVAEVMAIAAEVATTVIAVETTAKNVVRGKPLPPGIAKKTLPASMINDLPYYPGYEWRAVGDDLVLVALSTAIVTSVINGVFD